MTVNNFEFQINGVVWRVKQLKEEEDRLIFCEPLAVNNALAKVFFKLDEAPFSDGKAMFFVESINLDTGEVVIWPDKYKTSLSLCRKFTEEELDIICQVADSLEAERISAIRE